LEQDFTTFNLPLYVDRIFLKLPTPTKFTSFIYIYYIPLS